MADNSTVWEHVLEYYINRQTCDITKPDKEGGTTYLTKSNWTSASEALVVT